MRTSVCISIPNNAEFEQNEYAAAWNYVNM